MSITEFIESPGYKKIMGKVYGLGASVVILGALWKILHLPGASYMLIAGLGTEAIIFALSAFEPPHQMPDWSLVYPELVGLESTEPRHQGGGGHGGGSDLAALIQSGHLEDDVIAKLSDGIKKLNTTTAQLSDLSEANVATDSYLKNMQAATSSVSVLSNSQLKTAQVLESSVGVLAQSYDSAAQTITNSGNRFAEQMDSSGQKIVSDLTKSGEQMVSAYSQLSQSMSQDMNKVVENSQGYVQQLEGMNGNLAAINSVYELQLKSTQTQMQSANDMTKSFETIKLQMTQSAIDSLAYKEQMAVLSKSVAELNTIYSNMLSAMNISGRS